MERPSRQASVVYDSPLSTTFRQLKNWIENMYPSFVYRIYQRDGHMQTKKLVNYVFLGLIGKRDENSTMKTYMKKQWIRFVHWCCMRWRQRLVCHAKRASDTYCVAVWCVLGPLLFILRAHCSRPFFPFLSFCLRDTIASFNILYLAPAKRGNSQGE